MMHQVIMDFITVVATIIVWELLGYVNKLRIASIKKSLQSKGKSEKNSNTSGGGKDFSNIGITDLGADIKANNSNQENNSIENKIR